MEDEKQVSEIADEMGYVLTDQEIFWVIDNYLSYTEKYPEYGWNETVEIMIDDLKGPVISFNG